MKRIMKTEKIEDANFLKQDIAMTHNLTDAEVDLLHQQYVGFVNENYTLKTDKTHLDFILNQP